MPAPLEQLPAQSLAVQVPILMYHDLSIEDRGERFCLPVDRFEQQLSWLSQQGYHGISTAQLLIAVTEGASLPARPIILSFDDGLISHYELAFPRMQKAGFAGLIFPVVDWIGTPGHFDIPQLREMLAAGWELGGHSRSHPHLPASHPLVQSEVIDARRELETIAGASAATFAYPYGETDAHITNAVFRAGYQAAFGVESAWYFDRLRLFDLPRVEVRGTYTLDEFTALLPWQMDD